MKFTIKLILMIFMISGSSFSQDNKALPQEITKLIDMLKTPGELSRNHSMEFKFLREQDDLLAFGTSPILKVLGYSGHMQTRIIKNEVMLADSFLISEQISQSWDGTQWVNQSRYTYLYDARNNEVQYTAQSWNVNVWENNYRYITTFNANNDRTEYLYQDWNGTAWVNSSRQLYTYDINGDQIEQISQTWGGTAWNNGSRVTRTFDSRHNIIQQIYQSWNGTTWDNSSKTTYTYDSNNNNTQVLGQQWNGTAWVNYYLNTYTFDANNNEIMSLYQSWDGTQFVNDVRYLRTFDSNNNMLEYIYQSWDVSVWKNQSRYTYSYDANNNVIEMLAQTWDVSVWKNNYKYQYVYNANNDPIELLVQSWNVSVWQNELKLTLIYDSFDNITTYLLQSWDGAQWVNANQNLYYYTQATTLELTSPNGGENWRVGSSHNITWATNNIANVKIQYSTNNGTSWINIANVPASGGSYSWTIPNTVSTNCKVLLSDVSNSLVNDTSNSTFSISPPLNPSITVNAPNGGEDWTVGTSYFITWSSTDVDSVKLEYTTNNGTNWINIISSTPSDGSYGWTVPSTPSANCKVKITDAASPENDQSDAVFTISTPGTPTIAVTSPNGGENWTVGSSHTLTWISELVTNVKIEYTTNNGTSWISIIASTPSDGNYNWTVPNSPSVNCKVQITDVTNSSVNDQSNNVFTISTAVTPVISITAPNGGENWIIGSTRDITWISGNVTNVKIDYSTNNGTNWTNIISSTPSDGSYSWTIPNAPSSSCKLLISDASNASTADTSNAVFTIFEYASSITLNTSYSFGDPTKTASYQMVGLPGVSNIPVNTVLSGTAGKSGDWRVFWDSGSGSYTEFNGSSTFNFSAGKAFWIVSKNQININQNVNSVGLSSDNSYTIPLHNEWNLISNPFNKSITWSSVQVINTMIQPIHFFQNGSYSVSSNFDPYKGYYFYNSGSLSGLKIPYSSGTGKVNSFDKKELKISLFADNVRKTGISAGTSEYAEQGVDQMDIFSPPSEFCNINIAIYNREIETNYKFLSEEYRKEIGDGQEFILYVKNLSGEKLNLVLNGVGEFSDYEIYLLDKQIRKMYDMKTDVKIDINSNTAQREFVLLIGNQEFISQKTNDLLPVEFSLYQNYPNPFNPETKIMFALPKQSQVSLEIYNVLGELVSNLISNGILNAGYYEFSFDGSSLVSGVYLYKLQTKSSGGSTFIDVKKMILVK